MRPRGPTLQHRSLAALCGLIAALSSSACWPPRTEPGRVCKTELRIRLPVPSPLSSGSDGADVAHMRVENEQGSVVEQSTFLYGSASGTGDVRMVDLQGDPPEIPWSSSLRVELQLYSAQTRRIFALGQTSVFSCADEAVSAVPLYLGPANGLAATAELPGPRTGATASTLPDGRVLIVGGQGSDGQAARPVALLYDHRTGTYCSDCVTGALPVGRVGHTATSLVDGSVLILGGKDPQQSTPLAGASLYEPATGQFRSLISPTARLRHVAVQLVGDAIPLTFRNQVLVAAGSDASSVLSSAELVDVTSDRVITLASLAVPRQDAAMALAASGKVLIVGGRDGSGDPVPAVDLFDPDSGLFAPPAQACPLLAGANSLCAARASATATVLDDGNVLIAGGEVRALAGTTDAPPQLEVFLTDVEKSLPATADAASLAGRTGHTATRLACSQPPCQILLAGGQDLGSGLPLAPALFTVAASAPLPGDLFYPGMLASFTSTPVEAARAGHAATVLDDGGILLVGGEQPASGATLGNGAIFTPCTPVADDARLCPAITP
ncbi:MAG: hypothetical protein ABIJ09_22780 [Pseudomonadota bacterium]